MDAPAPAGEPLFADLADLADLSDLADLAYGGPAQRFVLLHRPQGDLLGLVVYVHPWAEELNKARRMAAWQSRVLAAQGYAVLQLDLLGCGDSPGDFGDATWARWVADAVCAARWLRRRHPLDSVPLWWWGLRGGALLAAEAAARMPKVPQHFVFWQPAAAGRPLLQQFLRLKAAGDLLGGQAKAVLDQARADLAAGRPIEVAGYALHPELAAGLGCATLHPPAGVTPGHVAWLEVSPLDDATLGPAAATATAGWRAAGWSVQTAVVRGPAFWQTTEIEDAPALIDATLAALTGPLTPPPAPAGHDTEALTR